MIYFIFALQGCTNASTFEPVTGILVQCTPLLHLPVIDPTQNLAFPMNVIALLPYMILHYEDANPICILAAENIAQVRGSYYELNSYDREGRYAYLYTLLWNVKQSHEISRYASCMIASCNGRPQPRGSVFCIS